MTFKSEFIEKFINSAFFSSKEKISLRTCIVKPSLKTIIDTDGLSKDISSHGKCSGIVEFIVIYKFIFIENIVMGMFLFISQYFYYFNNSFHKHLKLLLFFKVYIYFLN